MTATTRRLLSYLYRPINPDPDAVLGLTLDYGPEAMTFRVRDGRLTTTVTGNPAANLDIDLADLRIAELVNLVNAAPGYTSVFGSIEDGQRAAITLLDVDGDPLQPNGNELLAYRSLVWAYMHAVGRQLDLARAAIAAALAELRIDTATGEWLDLWRELTIGGRRLNAETDVALRARVISTILQLKCNNVALELAVLEQTGIAVRVVDIPWYAGDETLYTFGGPLWNASQVTNSATARTPPAAAVDATVVGDFGLMLLRDGRPAYGPINNNQPLIAAFAVVFTPTTTVADRERAMAVVERFRAAGTTPVAYRDARPLRTNTVGEGTNNPTYQVGPVGDLYAFWSY
ncbi:hypothetical protein [Nevskia sp.]|uniref:hypothetical protein n=1 Tax=Nevskia sp. TaxID=1929292 RepID=UPI0025D06FFD|nr:hypothetical protein [Nevskia sp.]